MKSFAFTVLGILARLYSRAVRKLSRRILGIFVVDMTLEKSLLRAAKPRRDVHYRNLK